MRSYNEKDYWRISEEIAHLPLTLRISETTEIVRLHRLIEKSLV